MWRVSCSTTCLWIASSVAPGLTASIAAICVSSTTSYRRRCAGENRAPIGDVRVTSAV